MKKKLSLFVCMISLSIFSFAQDSVNKKVEIGFRINTPEGYNNNNTYPTTWHYGISKNKSFSVGIINQYSFTQVLSARLRADISKINTSHLDTTYNSSTSYNTLLSTYNQTIFAIAPGIFFTNTHERLSFYGGMEIPIKLFGKYICKQTQRYYPSSPPNVAISTGKTDGGIAIGIGGVLGFKYNVFRRFYLGCEFAGAILYYHSDGKFIESYSGFPNSTTNKITKSNGTFIPPIMFSVNFSYLF